MKDATLEANGEPFVHGNGSLQYGATIIAPWPSLHTTPMRTTALVREILWAEPGDRVWPFTARIPRMLRQLL